MSLSTAETPVILAPTAVPRDAAEKMLRYLVFHRSLLGEAEDTSALLERYLTLVENLKEGVHLVIPDPFQKATALLFELVMDQEFDPWEIDLVKFTQAYLDRVKEDGGVNFAIAGRLVYMAWSILYLQSEVLLRSRENPPDASGDRCRTRERSRTTATYPSWRPPKRSTLRARSWVLRLPHRSSRWSAIPRPGPSLSSSSSGPSTRPRWRRDARSGSRSCGTDCARSSTRLRRSSSTGTCRRPTSRTRGKPRAGIPWENRSRSSTCGAH